ncbi:ATP-binding protein [Pararhizobium haloflavum]|uniref:ATP-binding protein n=1 Tax=Pararhizobium haloflavum TaxID=2037914 RepID=UPI000C19D7AE|nr:ATP-binding protein [Pararhizobium haloflavum]
MTDLSRTPRVDESTTPDRRAGRNPRERLLGRVVACSGSRATICALAEQGDVALAELWSVGRLISIKVGENRVVALVYSMGTQGQDWQDANDTVMHFEVELVGEIKNGADNKPVFSSGISQYPHLGAIAHRIRTADLSAIYDTGRDENAVIGKLTQDDTMDARIHIPSLLTRHFAVVGTTGVGKSTAVSLILKKAIASSPDLRVLILDPHNEFAAAFPDTSIVIETDTLDLPFWLFRLEEFVEVLFRGRPGVPEEIDALRDLIPEAKRAFRGAADNALFRRSTDKSSLTADTPVPYRMADLLALVDERLGRLEGRTEKPHLRALKVRIMSAINDPRFHFMFSSNTINDTIVETLGHIFRIPCNGRPISCFQLAGIPSEVVDSVASVLCRMAFEIALWSNGGVRILVLCEEAHRYVPADPNLGFVPTRQAISRIAKEGRKYGVCLGVVTQRPGELDPTILSQCSTVFAMRLANDQDQEIIRSAIPDSSASTTSFLSAIGNREAIAFGEAVAVPMRMMFETIPEQMLPKANGFVKGETNADVDLDLRSIVQKMRHIAANEAAPTALPQAGSETLAPTAPQPQPGDGPLPQRRFSDRQQSIAGEHATRTGYRLPDTAPAPARDPAVRASLFKKPLGSILK